MEKVEAKDYLGKTVDVEMDRPLGTRHPKHGFMYMINYGLLLMISQNQSQSRETCFCFTSQVLITI